MKVLICSLMFGCMSTYTVTPHYPIDYSRLALNTSEHFGKTHFIVGYPQQPIEIKKPTPPRITRHIDLLRVTPDGSIRSVYFSPRDNIRDVLFKLIEKEQKNIRIAMFSFTDKTIAEALIQAQQRGIHVELVTDPICLHDRHNKITMLQDAQLPVFIYNQQRSTSTQPGVMHHKFILFAQNVDNKSLLWTGSFNFTRSANNANQENVLVLDDQSLFDTFAQQFEQLKQCCDQYQSTQKN